MSNRRDPGGLPTVAQGGGECVRCAAGWGSRVAPAGGLCATA